MNNAKESGTCAHGPCDCATPENEKYCSVYCENAAKVGDTEIGCSCGHAACR